jgi:outer membrane scaffolding protein for murein synthesis (MipA/OmpV family)
MRLTLLATAFAAFSALAPASAQQRPATDWTVTVGAAVVGSPRFEGSERMRAMALPFFDVRFRDLFFASFNEGVGVNLLSRDIVGTGVEGLAAGPLLRWRFGRDQDAAPVLRGLGDVDFAGEAGAFVSYTFQNIARLRVEARRGFGGHEGTLVDGSFSLIGRFGDVMVSVGPTLSWASGAFNQTYFGVTPQQSARSGLAVYTPGSGLRSFGVNGTIGWRVTESIGVTAFGGWSRLQSVATDSPIIRAGGNPNQFSVGGAVTWRFGF